MTTSTDSMNVMAAGAGAVPQPAVALRRFTRIALALTVASVQFSIAIGEIFLAVTVLSWCILLVVERRLPAAPPWIVPLLLFAGWTVVSAAFSPERAVSIADCKQLVLLLLVP